MITIDEITLPMITSTICEALAHSPPPNEHLGLFWWKKKHQVFFPAADETLHTLKLFFKLDK
jgi:hypothetical protein